MHCATLCNLVCRRFAIQIACKQALRTGYSKANLGITHTESLFAGYNRESEVNLTKSCDTRAFNLVLQSADYITFNTVGVHV